MCNLASVGLPMYVEEPSYEDLNVKVYSKGGCIYCTYVKNYLKSKDIKYWIRIDDIVDSEMNDYKIDIIITNNKFK